MKKLVIALFSLVFVTGCDTSGCFDDETDWETDSVADSQPSAIPSPTKPGKGAGMLGNQGVKGDVDSDDYRIGDELERIVNPISSLSDEQSTK